MRGRITRGHGGALCSRHLSAGAELLWSLPTHDAGRYVVIAALAGFPSWHSMGSAASGSAPAGFRRCRSGAARRPLCRQSGLSSGRKIALGTVETERSDGFLHLLQPLARLDGAFPSGTDSLAQLCRNGHFFSSLPVPKTFTVWSEEWHSPLTGWNILKKHEEPPQGWFPRGGDTNHWIFNCAAAFGLRSSAHGSGKHGRWANSLLRFRTLAAHRTGGNPAHSALAAPRAGAAFAQAWIAPVCSWPRRSFHDGASSRNARAPSPPWSACSSPCNSKRKTDQYPRCTEAPLQGALLLPILPPAGRSIEYPSPPSTKPAGNFRSAV
jgi:hypothetical protein